jgi:hypothetical protein
MKLIKRCYGCGKVIWPWQNIINTKKVGYIHKDCLIAAWYSVAFKESFIVFSKSIHKKQIEHAMEYLGDKKE